MADLATRITELATSIRTKINAMMPRILPQGGTAGQVLAKVNAVDYNVGWVSPSGGGGGGASGTVGTGEIDFGAHPGSSKASLVITGQAAITAGSVIEAWVVAKDTVDHSADEHLVDTPRLICGAIVLGTGFTIYAMPRETRRGPLSPLHRGQRKTAKSSLPYGKWSIAWRWQ
jgi:hypothetical protein